MVRMYNSTSSNCLEKQMELTQKVVKTYEIRDLTSEEYKYIYTCISNWSPNVMTVAGGNPTAWDWDKFREFQKHFRSAGIC